MGRPTYAYRLCLSSVSPPSLAVSLPLPPTACGLASSALLARPGGIFCIMPRLTKSVLQIAAGHNCLLIHILRHASEIPHAFWHARCLYKSVVQRCPSPAGGGAPKGAVAGPICDGRKPWRE